MSASKGGKKANAYCCEILALAVDDSRARAESGRATPGLVQAYLFNLQGQNTRNPVVYAMPARGRGKARVNGRNILIEHCPFCGTKQDPEAK